ncbi:MAG: S8 family peptidase [Armatimonadetes bacterium]|nr:S8 family peptidase [Armatimonadota bacterium]
MVRGQGGKIRYTYHLVPAIAAELSATAAAALADNPTVKSVEPDLAVQAADAELDSSWGVKRIGGGTAHDSGFKGTGVKVGVIDTGIDYNHPDLAANYAGGYDFVNNDADPFDDNSHGTHVSGTIAAVQNATGVVGVAPEARLYALKVLAANGSGSYSAVIAALQWCVDNGVQVTNNSYGSSGDPGSTVKAAFDNAAAAGVIHVAAAGNSGTSAGTEDNVIYPARYASAIAVAATDSTDTRAYFSCTGADVELAAPGVSIRSTVPGGGYASYSGTSMATPHVAGTVALCLGAGKTDVRDLLDATATDLGTAGRDTWYGYGLVNCMGALGGSAPAPDPGPAPPPGSLLVTVTTDQASYSNGATVKMTVKVTDAHGQSLGGAAANLVLTAPNGSTWSATGTTGTGGAVVFTRKLNTKRDGRGSANVQAGASLTAYTPGTGTASFTIA